MQIQGKVIRMLATETVGANNFTKRVIHIETDSNTQYPQVLAVEFQGDRISLTDKLKPGSTATFHINLRGREWTDKQGEIKAFNTIVVWKLDDINTGSPVVDANPGNEADGNDLLF